MAAIKIIRIIFKKVFVLALTVLAIIGAILVSPLLILIYIWRYTVNIASKFLRPDLRKILTCRSSIFAVDELYTGPRATLEVGLFLEGVPDVAEAHKFLTERLIKLRRANGELARPELTQYICQWMGFYFWKEDEHFDIANHLHDYDGPLKAESYDEFAMYEISKELTAKPFQKGRSPWEFVLIYNTKKDLSDENEIPTTCVMLRVHHSLADGFSILGLVTELIASEGSLEPMLPKPIEIPIWKKALLTVSLPILGTFELLESLVEALDLNQWHLPERKLSRIIHGAVYDKISIDYIKEIKNAYGVGFTSVIMAAFAGGIRSFMLENGFKVPKKIHCLAPLPMPGHSGKLRNYMTICYVTLPVGMRNPQQRLKTIDKHLFKLRKSTAPYFLFHIIPFLGGLFPFMIKLLGKQIFVTAITSNFPGPAHKVTYLGIPIADIIFGGGFLPGNIGVGITSISYDGFIRIAAGIDQSIIPKSIPIKSLVEKVAQELDILKKEVIV